MTAVRNLDVINNFEPLLSVFCWTFNDRNYIIKCLEGILDQEIDFSIEIIVHDDASDDGTKDILIQYSNKYPGLFSNILNLENKWSKGINVSIPLFSKPRGKYISLLHGDDYWTDRLKLQKQVDFLEKHTNYSFCFHKIHYTQNDKIFGSYYKSPPKNTLYLKQILKEHYVPTSSVVFRKSMLKIPEDIYYEMYFNDICLELYLSINGPVFYFNEIMGVYRNNEKSISNQIKYLIKGRSNLIKMYTKLRSFLNGKSYILVTMLILKNRLGYYKDYFGSNQNLK